MKLSLVLLSSITAMALASPAAVNTASTMQVVMENLKKAGQNFEKINDLLNGFPENGAKGAAEIMAEETLMQTATSEVTANLALLSQPVSNTNVQKVVDAFQAVIPKATQSLNQISAKVADFSALGDTTVTQLTNSLVVSNSLCGAVSNAIAEIAPPAMADTLAPALDQVNAAFVGAMAALSSTISN